MAFKSWVEFNGGCDEMATMFIMMAFLLITCSQLVNKRIVQFHP